MNTYFGNKTLFITGACSYVGKFLVQYLLEQNYPGKLVLCCRDKEKAVKLFADNQRITLVTANLENPESYKDIFAIHKPSFVIHLAAVARFKQGQESPVKTVKTNFFGSVNLIRLSENQGVEKFLYISSNLARNPKGVTGYSKYLVEAYTKLNTLKVQAISLRLPNVIDSPDAVTLVFKNQIDKNLPVTITDKRMSRKFITPGMAAEQIVFTLKNGKHGDIFINNRPSTPIVELAKEMIKKSGKDIQIKFIGARPGEKLEEEDYPGDMILATKHNELFILKKDVHSGKEVKEVLNKLSEYIPAEIMEEINKLLFNKI